jgi:hypothetical protein
MTETIAAIFAVIGIIAVLVSIYFTWRGRYGYTAAASVAVAAAYLISGTVSLAGDNGHSGLVSIGVGVLWVLISALDIAKWRKSHA